MRTKNASDGQKRPSFIEAARRAQLIECAIETSATLGYAQASLAQIAKRAGISKSVITYYFSSKEELIEQVVKEIYTDAARYTHGVRNEICVLLKRYCLPAWWLAKAGGKSPTSVN